MLAIIPARGGSKGVPGKNIKLLCGKPLIAYAIDEALAAKSINRVLVSTDDNEIAALSGEYGAEVPFMRPPELARDDSSAIDVYLYTLEQLNQDREDIYTDFVVLQPTSPFRTAGDIDRAIELYTEKQAESVIAVTEAAHPPVWAKKIGPEGKLSDYFPSLHDNRNRQEIETAYLPNGAIFVLQSSLLQERGTYYSDRTYPYLMPAERSIDIDTPLDFLFAEFYMGRQLNLNT